VLAPHDRHLGARLGELPVDDRQRQDRPAGSNTSLTLVPDRDTPLRAVRLRFADRAAEMLGPSPVAPFSIPVFRTGAADSLAEIRAAHPPPAG